MLHNYVKTAYRSLRKQRFYTFLNVFGLSLGIAGGLILFQFISYHLSFDTYHRNAAHLYRVVTDMHLPDGSTEYEQGSPLGMAPALQGKLSQVKDQATLLRIHTMSIGVREKFFAENENIAFTDAHWFHLFDYTWLKGNPETALEAPNTVVITRALADKYFGKEDPIGKTIRLDNKYNVAVTGVLENPPTNTDLGTQLFLSRASFRSFYPDLETNLGNNWSDIRSTTSSYVQLSGPVSPERIKTAMGALIGEHMDTSVASVFQFHLQPLEDLHFDGRYGGSVNRSMLLTLAIAGFFLVVMACFNFINLSTAQSVKRAREIGTRKVLGGTRASLFWQFITETACIGLMAAALSFAWVGLVLPVLNEWLQIQLTFDFWKDRSLLLCLSGLICLVVLGGGFYPALVLSRWKPVDVLKNQINRAGTTGFRKGLIVIQNVLVQVLIICTLVITLQVRHIKTTDPGFNKENVLMVPIPDADKSKLTYLSTQWKTNPGIQSVSFCYQAPLSESNWGGSVSYDEHAWENFPVRNIMGDADYVQTFHLELIAGRPLKESDAVREFIVNETLVHKLGITDPQQVLGHRMIDGALGDHAGTIVGVVKDFNVHPLYTAMEPAMITTQRTMYRFAAIRLNTANASDVRGLIRRTWESAYPSNVFDYHYLNDQIDEYYHKEDLLDKLVSATAGIAIVISCLGLLGLISFFAVQRTKEIGIRKVLGAGVASIVYLLARDFLRLVALSILVASPIAWWFMNRWLQEFAYRITISWWIFALAGLGSAFIAMATVGYQSIRAAVANPVESPRTE